MTKPKIGVQEVHDAACRVVLNYGPEHVDPYGGRYADSCTGELRCIVAHILLELGASSESIRELDARPNPFDPLSRGIVIAADSPNLTDNMPFDLTMKAHEYLLNIQGRQDNGHQWGCILAQVAESFNVEG